MDKPYLPCVELFHRAEKLLEIDGEIRDKIWKLQVELDHLFNKLYFAGIITEDIVDDEEFYPGLVFVVKDGTFKILVTAKTDEDAEKGERISLYYIWGARPLRAAIKRLPVFLTKVIEVLKEARNEHEELRSLAHRLEIAAKVLKLD